MSVKLSIIIPNYNKGEYIEECLNSIINQNYSDYEIIVIDDCSTDNSLSILEKFNKKYEFITLIKHNYNKNGSNTRNEGIEIAKGDYILFFDSDDILEPNILKICMKKIIETNADLLIANYYNLKDSKKAIDINNDVVDDVYIGKAKIFNRIVNLPPVPGNKIFKKDIIIKNKIYWANILINQDLSYYYKYILFCDKVVTIADLMYSHRYVSDSVYNVKNFNLFYSNAAFSDIKNFYIRNNNEELYNRYIPLVIFRNCLRNIYKSLRYSSYKERILICKYYEIEESKLDYSKCALNNEFRKKRIKFKIMTFLKYIYCLRDKSSKY